jgi:calcineurin-like phosphoesterase family protein
MLFLTSDPHYGHENIIKYCSRPFRDVNHMNTEMVRRWNMTVGPNDQVIILGDFALWQGAIPKYVPLLQGQKFLVPGNHDHVWKFHKKFTRERVEEAEEAGITVLPPLLFLSDVTGDPEHKKILLCHFQFMTDTEHKYYKYSPPPSFISPPGARNYREDRGTVLWDILLHGHIHNHRTFADGQINVGVDVWDFYPVSLERLLREYEMKYKWTF